MSASGINPSDHSRISGGIETGRRREPAVWTDLHGQQHVERVSEVPDHDGAVPRVIGDIEHSWELAGTKRRSELAAQMLSQPNPIVTDTATTPNPFLLACASEIKAVLTPDVHHDLGIWTVEVDVIFAQCLHRPVHE